MRTLRVLLFLLVCLPTFAATPSRAAAPKASRGASDAEIERAVRARLARSKISVDGFQVHVQGGVATIEGRTGVVQHKGVATRLAHSAGATQVVNKVQISDAAKQKLLTQLHKGGKAAQVK